MRHCRLGGNVMQILRFRGVSRVIALFPWICPMGMGFPWDMSNGMAWDWTA